MKLTFTGDVTCDRPLLNAANVSGKTYDYSGMFSALKPLFSDSDFVIGNLETVFCSSQVKYNKDLHYNSPDTLLDEIRAAGFNVLTTANNHSFDGGMKGLTRTVEMLDARDIRHVGTYPSSDAPRYILLEADGIRIAVLAYTYALNRYPDIRIPVDIDRYVDLLYPCYRPESAVAYLKRSFRYYVGRWMNLLRKKRTISTYQDKLTGEKLNPDYLAAIEKNLQAARQDADLVIVCMHIGGQFNEIPGAYSEYMAQFMRDHGADVVIGHHPHTIQRVERSSGSFCAYSLGGLNLSPSAIYIDHACKPEYSLLIHLYPAQKAPPRITFSLVKGIEDERAFLRVFPVYDLWTQADAEGKEKLEADVASLLTRILGHVPAGELILPEYELSV